MSGIRGAPDFLTRRAFVVGTAGWCAAGACNAESGPVFRKNQVDDPCVRRIESVPTRYQPIETAFCGDARHESVVGASVAIGADGKIAFTSTQGVRCKGQAGEVTSSTPFRIGSVTKSLTGLLAATLASRGVLKLDVKIARILDDVRFEPSPHADHLTLFHLLTHTSGATDDEAPHHGLPTQVRLESPPGAKWLYCNLGYQLAGLVIERLTAMSYERLLIDEVLLPLALESTAVATHEAGHPQWSCEHVAIAGRQVPHTTEHAFSRFAGGVRTVAPAGAVVSSASDLVRFALATCSPGPSASIWKQTVSTGTPGLEYGLGVFVRKLDSDLLVYHHGNTGTSAAELYWMPRRRMAVATLANTARPLRATVVAALRHIGEVPMDALRGSLAARPQ